MPPLLCELHVCYRIQANRPCGSCLRQINDHHVSSDVAHGLSLGPDTSDLIVNFADSIVLLSASPSL